MQFANIEWREGQPYSIDFNDVYFNNESGLEETEYVFIAQNHLTERFASTQSETFTIIETGFGTGLNFFCASSHWLARSPIHAKLQYISIEKWPLSPADLENTISLWPQFAILFEDLSQQYSNIKMGLNTFKLMNDRIQLDLWIGDVNEILPNIQEKTDAWFLDGFAPAKNSAMWSSDVFKHVARLSYNGTTFATFTSAGAVRRGLQSTGFHVHKQAGFGKKREMLRGIFVDAAI